MITPVLLCGGSGTRLWPLSRRSYPKQFSPLIGSNSLFQASAQRLSGHGYTAPVVVTADAFRFIVAEQLAGTAVQPGAILIEPEPRDTAPAVLAAALHVAADAPQALMLVAPSDHVIPDAAALQRRRRRGGAGGRGRAHRHLRHRPRPAGNRLWLSGTGGRPRPSGRTGAATAGGLRREARRRPRRGDAGRRPLPVERRHLPVPRRRDARGVPHPCAGSGRGGVGIAGRGAPRSGVHPARSVSPGPRRGRSRSTTR